MIGFVENRFIFFFHMVLIVGCGASHHDCEENIDMIQICYIENHLLPADNLSKFVVFKLPSNPQLKEKLSYELVEACIIIDNAKIRFMCQIIKNPFNSLNEDFAVRLPSPIRANFSIYEYYNENLSFLQKNNWALTLTNLEDGEEICFKNKSVLTRFVLNNKPVDINDSLTLNSVSWYIPPPPDPSELDSLE